MSNFLLLPGRRHWSVFGGHLIANALGLSKATAYRRGAALLVPVSNRVSGSARMGFCSCVVETSRQTFDAICHTVKVLGIAVCKCFGRCCICSDCLPSSAAVGSCVGRFLACVIMAVCCPCLSCWCICKAIAVFRRRNHDPRDSIDPDQTSRGYNTFDNDVEQQDSFEGFSERPLKNYLFYSNQIPSEPNGARIDEILKDWHGRYDLLENHHGYIQWLFPLYEQGVNYRAEPLTGQERQLILDNHDAHQRMEKSCRLMLDFYGINFDVATGELSRNENYRERFRNLNTRSHNNLRISRIIKCLVIFNYRHLAKSIVKFFITEICKEGNLPNCRSSCKNFWVPALHQDDVLDMQIYANKLERGLEEPDLLSDHDPVKEMNPDLEESPATKEEAENFI